MTHDSQSQGWHQNNCKKKEMLSLACWRSTAKGVGNPVWRCFASFPSQRTWRSFQKFVWLFETEIEILIKKLPLAPFCLSGKSVLPVPSFSSKIEQWIKYTVKDTEVKIFTLGTTKKYDPLKSWLQRDFHGSLPAWFLITASCMVSSSGIKDNMKD